MSSSTLDLGAQPVTLAQQIEELKRELRQRAAVYPRLIAAGKLSERRAAHQTYVLEAVIATLEALRRPADAPDARIK